MNDIELYGEFVPFITTAQGLDFSKLTHLDFLEAQSWGVAALIDRCADL